jgi:hypothetical protein
MGFKVASIIKKSTRYNRQPYDWATVLTHSLSMTAK